MKKFLLIAAMSLSMGAFCASAQTETDEKTSVPESAAMLQVAGQLVKYGYAQQQALPLIQAADIYATYLNDTDPAGEKASEADATAGEEQAKVEKPAYTTAQLLTDATNFADEDASLLALIDGVKAKATATRGPVSNYGVHHDTVRAHSTDTYSNIRFRGGEQACVIVSGDGDTDLDLYIYDANGNLIARDIDRTDDCVCVWTPRWTGNFTIKIKNLGPVYNRYQMAIF